MNFDCLSPREIRERYNWAADKSEILQVLADLTCSTPAEVAGLLNVEYRPRSVRCAYTPKTERKSNVKVNPEKMLALYQQGKTDKEIAAELDYSVTSVGKWRRKMGLALIPAAKPCVDSDAAMGLYRKGFTDRQIANLLGVTKSAIIGWRHRKGLVCVSKRVVSA